MQTIGSDFFPKKRNRIQSQNFTSNRNIIKNDVQKFEEKVRARPVQIHLIGTEGGPNMALSLTGLIRRQQGRGPWANHHGQIRFRISFHDIIKAGFHPGYIFLEPGTFG